MEKITVETAGTFMLVDIFGGQEIAAFGPTKVNKTDFVANALRNEQLKLVGGKKTADVDAPKAETIPALTTVQVIPEAEKPAVTKPSSGKASAKKE